jgi:hypothetical protein
VFWRVYEGLKLASSNRVFECSKVRFRSRLIGRMVAIGGVVEVDTSYSNTQPGSEGYLGRYLLLWRVLESASTDGFSEEDRDFAVASRQSWED